MNQEQPKLSQHNQKVFIELEGIVDKYPLRVQLLEQTVQKIQEDEDSEVNFITSKMESIFKTLLMTLLNVDVCTTSPDWEKTCGLPEDRLITLKQVLEVVCGGPASQKLKRSIVISFIENVLECLGVSDITEVLGVISAQIPRFARQLEEVDELKLLRVINFLLKTVSKTQDYQLRGQLHLALSRFLPYCHDSGFHFRGQPSKASEWESINSISEDQVLQQGVSFQFYQQFWQLQQLLIEPSEFSKEGATQPLKKVEQILKEVQKYFSTHPANQHANYYNQPIKFLKNYNLLTLQLADYNFRKTIMLQVLFFAHTLQHPLTRAPLILSEVDKKLIHGIQSIANNFFISCGPQGKKILEDLPQILGGELQWTQIKEQWKDKKKATLKRGELFVEEQVSKKQERRKVEKQIEKKRSEARKYISQKMKIEGQKIQKFLQSNQPINLQQKPTYASFDYYFSQAVNCLKSFDHQTGRQTEFQTRAEYNMFEWKAMRSLYRQNLRDIWSSTDKAATNMKEYRLISLMSRKEDEFAGPQPQKKVKRE